MSQRVGIVGTGILGRGVAEKLLARDFPLAVYDPRREALEGLAARGALACASNRELATHCDRICVWVQNDEQCEQALGGDSGLLAGIRPGAAIAIHSTVHPRTVQQLAERCARQEIPLIDAPVAGQGVMSLERGDFWMLAGGDERVLERFRAIAETFCERILACGPLGSGAVLKLAHNVATYVGYVAAVEAQALARAAGVREGLLEAVTQASGTLSPAMKLMLVTRDRRLGGAADAFGDAQMRTYAAILEKDLRVAIEVANERGLALPAAALVSQRAEFIYALKRREG